jgi:hypothetical protein
MAVIFGVVIGFYAIAAIAGHFHHRVLLKRFPPISDAEFARRCGPDVDPAIAIRVRRILAEALAFPYESIDPSHRLSADLGAD